MQRIVGRSFIWHMLCDVLCVTAKLKKIIGKKIMFFFFLLDVVGYLMELVGSKALPPQGSAESH